MTAAALSLLVVSFALGVGLCGLTRRLAPRVNLVDKPGGRKAHERVTPLGGGVAIWASMVAVLALGGLYLAAGAPGLPEELSRYVGGLKSRAWELGGLMGLATVIMLMGLADDRVGLGWKPRLAAQVGLSVIFVVFFGRITLFYPFNHPLLTGTITVLWIVGLTNAFNFLDNMDGLAAGVGLIAAGLFAGAQVSVGSLFVPAVLLILIGALGGFLVHNHQPARLFMGDAGSNFLGFLLGTLTVLGTFTREGYSPYGVLTPLLVMAVPLYDMTSVILIRAREGRSPFQADRRHFSHRLVARGLSPRHAVWTIDLVTLTCGLGALRLHELGRLGASLVVGQSLCVLGLVAILENSALPRCIETPERGDATARPAIDTP